MGQFFKLKQYVKSDRSQRNTAANCRSKRATAGSTTYLCAYYSTTPRDDHSTDPKKYYRNYRAKCKGLLTSIWAKRYSTCATSN